MKIEKKIASAEQLNYAHKRVTNRLVGYLIGCIIMLVVSLLSKFVNAGWYAECKKIVIGDFILAILICMVVMFIAMICLEAFEYYVDITSSAEHKYYQLKK